MRAYTVKYIQIGLGEPVRVFHALVHATSPMAASGKWAAKYHANVIVLSAEDMHNV